MKKLHKLTSTETNAASMADIAFLLLIFFMVTTTIVNDQGLDLLLPPHRSDITTAQISERNLFKILINSNDELLVENESRESYVKLRTEIKEFILNNGQRSDLSDTPQKAVISIKTNRGTSQGVYIHVLDEAKAAYYEIYADRAGISSDQFRKLDLHIPANKKLYEKARAGVPMNISIAEPD